MLKSLHSILNVGLYLRRKTLRLAQNVCTQKLWNVIELWKNCFLKQERNLIIPVNWWWLKKTKIMYRIYWGWLERGKKKWCQGEAFYNEIGSTADPMQPPNYGNSYFSVDYETSNFKRWPQTHQIANKNDHLQKKLMMKANLMTNIRMKMSVI